MDGREGVSTDAATLLARARSAGVVRFLVPGTTLDDSAKAIAIAERHDDVVAAVGIHPHEAKDFDPERDGAALEALARRPGVAAIGEIGLDFHYDLSPREKQIEVLEWMLDLARRLGKPVILHNRESGAEMLSLLARLSPRERPGVYHSFTEGPDYGRKAIDLGYRISFSGMITFRAAENIRAAAAALPLEAMLVETDALPRPRSAPREALRAGLRRRDGEEARGGEEDGPRRGRRGDHRQLRGALPPMTLGRFSPEQFDAVVEEALAKVPAAFRKYLENIVVVVEEEPLDEDYEETDTPDEEELFGIFRGIPYFHRETAVVSHLPAQIAIFRGPILRSCPTRGEAVREIRDTVVHEVGHMLGLGDEEMPY